MPNSLKSHIETLQEMFAVAANERRMKEADAITAAIEALSRAPIAEGGEGLCARLQGKCSDWGTYWRAPDAHGVQLSHAQAVELLVEALGVEVEIAAIESLSRQGGDMSKNPENIDASGERVYGIDTSQVEYDRELIAKMLDELEPVVGLQYIRESVANQARLLRAAANRDAAGVHTVRASEAGDWVLVPRVPTKEMCRAGLAERHDDLAKSIYAAMIAAAPAPGGGPINSNNQTRISDEN